MHRCQCKTKAKFTKEEDELIIKCVEAMKENDKKIKWAKISDYLPSRTSKQIRERYLNFLSPDVDRSPFSACEFKRLAETVLHYLHLPYIPWKEINVLFPGRSKIFLKNQYDHARRKILKNTFESDLERKKQNEFFHLLWDDASIAHMNI
jgi:hypothetical protein